MGPLGTAALAAAALMSFALLDNPAFAQKRGGTLRSYLPENPASGSPHEEATIYVAMPFSPVFNNLVAFDPDAKTESLDGIVPELATRWTWSEDDTKVTFTLQQGVKWHDGKPFTSADVKCTWDAVTGAADAKVRKNPRKAWYANLKEITVNGDHEVSFHLTRPQPSFMAFLAGAFSPVYPCHVAAPAMRTKPIGTGPFKFGEFKQNEYIRHTRNPDYWKPGLPYLDAIEWTIMPNRATAMLGFVSGQIDMPPSSQITPPVLKDIKARAPHLVCEMNATNTHSSLLVNRDQPPFDNADVRRAMALAIDRHAFLTALYDSEASIGGAMLPQPDGLWGMPADMLEAVPGYGRDIEKSRAQGRALMTALGYSAAKPLRIKLSTRNLVTYRDAAVLLVDHLKTVFIDSEMELLDGAVWYARLTRKDYQVGMNVTGVSIDDPDVNFYENYTCGSERNYTKYCNASIDKLIDAQSTTKDIAKRRELVWQVDRQLQEDVARPIFIHGRVASCRQPYVKGFLSGSNGNYNRWRLERVWLDK